MAIYMVKPVTTLDYRELARKRLPSFLFNYIDGGANDERTMAANSADFQKLMLRQQVLRDVSRVDTATSLAGQAVNMPLALAPVGLAGMMARRGEAQAARSAAGAGIPFTLSTVGICPIEEVSEASGGAFWFQLYMVKDRDLVVSLLERARLAGCSTLVFTVDLAVTGMRHRDLRYGMQGDDFPAKLSRALTLAASPRWVFDVAIKGKPHNFGNLSSILKDSTDLDAYKNFINSQFDPSVTWKDIAWLRSLWPGQLLIKGILTADDAREAREVGADGVVVSNHGGRQLDGVSSTISKLPGIASAVGKDIEVFMDGGVRSGIDVVKAVALGARGVLIGRPWVWAVAARGEKGLSDLLEVYRSEIAKAMALMGVNSVAELNPELVEPYCGIS